MPSVRGTRDVMTRKKQTERYFLDAAREASAVFPDGDISERESPDFLFRSGQGAIGIEVTELFRPQGTADFPLQQAESFHERIMRKAEELYRQGSSPDVDVLVYFLNDCARRELTETAASLVSFVATHYQVGETHTFDGHADGFPAGFSVIRIAPPLPESTCPWRCLKSGGPLKLEQQTLAEAISEKEALLPRYRAAVGRIWLLVVIRAFPITTFWVPREICMWKFTFGFEKVLLFTQWDSKVIELSRATLNGP
jgi:hypothetical protein